jgi:putative ABC transport system permease protein
MKRLRRAWRAHGVASAGFGLLVGVCVFLAVAGPRTDQALRTTALQQSLAAASPVARSVSGTVDDTGLTADLGQLPDAGSVAAVGGQMEANLAKDHLPLAGAADNWAGLTAPVAVVLSGLAPAVTGPLRNRFELAYRSGLGADAAVAAGRLPSVARAAGGVTTFEVAVSAATAARFGLRPGSRIQASAGTPLTLVVTAVLRPRGPSPTFWPADGLLVAPVQETVNDNYPPIWVGGAFVGAAELPLFQQVFNRASMNVIWSFPLVTSAITADSAQALSGALTRAATQAGLIGSGAEPVTLTSPVAGVLADFVPADAAAGSVLRLLAVSLAVIAVVVVLLGSQLLVRRRRAELTVLRARGASPPQVALRTLRGAAIPAACGAAAGTALAVALTPGHADPLSRWLGGAILLAAVAAAPLIALREQRAPGQRHGSRGGGSGAGLAARLGGRGAWRRVAAELTLAAAAVAGVVVLRQQGSGALPSLAPVLVAVPVAIVVMRCYPFAVRGLLRLAGRRRGVAAFTGLARAARSSPGAVLPGIALVLALAVAAFGFLVRAAVTDGQAAQSWQQTGADALINAQLAFQPPSAAFARDVSAVPGVRHVTLVSDTSGQADGSQVPVAALQPGQYAALLAGAPLPPFPAAALAAPAPGGTSPVPALVTPAGAAALGPGGGEVAGIGQDATLTVGLQSVRIRITGEIAGLAGIPGAPQVILPASALDAGADAAPNVVLVTGPDIDVPRLDAVVRRDLPGATVTLRATVQAALSRAPLPRDEAAAIVAAEIAAAGLTLLVLLIMIAGAARARRSTVARLRVMGVTGRQARWAELAETLPLVVATAVGGVACAWALGPLIGPALNLSALTGGATAPVGARWAPLGAAAAGLLILTLLAVSLEAMTSRSEESRNEEAPG